VLLARAASADCRSPAASTYPYSVHLAIRATTIVKLDEIAAIAFARAGYKSVPDYA
jgi:hypothetical protein